MLSNKVDLTEHHDFGDPSPHLSFWEINSWIDSPFMTKDDADTIFEWENIFGRKKHYTEALDVFREDDAADFQRKLRTTCTRCGTYVPIPWKLKHNLCPDCRKKEDEEEERTIPWNNKTVAAFNRFNDARDIFNIR